MDTDKNESKVKLGEDELNLAAGGISGLPKFKFRSIQSSSSGCIHGFNATCDHVGVNKDGVNSYEPCQFHAVENGVNVCTYNGE